MILTSVSAEHLTLLGADISGVMGEREMRDEGSSSAGRRARTAVKEEAALRAASSFDDVGAAFNVERESEHFFAISKRNHRIGRAVMPIVQFEMSHRIIFLSYRMEAFMLDLHENRRHAGDLFGRECRVKIDHIYRR